MKKECGAKIYITKFVVVFLFVSNSVLLSQSPPPPLPIPTQTAPVVQSVQLTPPVAPTQPVAPPVVLAQPVQQGQPAQTIVSVKPAVAALSLAGQVTLTSEQQFEEKLKEITSKEIKLEKINLCNQILSLVVQTTSQEQKNKLVKIFIDLFNLKDEMTKEEFEGLKKLFQSSLSHPFLLIPEQKTVMSQWMVILTIDDNYLQNLLNSAENKPYLEQQALYSKVLGFITPSFVQTFIPKIGEFYNNRAQRNLEELKVLNDFFVSVKNNSVISANLPPNFAEWQQSIFVYYQLKLIEDVKNDLEKINLCQKLLSEITVNINVYEKKIFYTVLFNLYSNYVNMDKPILQAFKGLLDGAVAKENLFSDEQIISINEWLVKLATALTDFQTSLELEESEATVVKYDNDFNYLKTTFEIFENKPDRSFVASVVPALNNVWSNRPKEKEKLLSLKKLFEKMNERDDVLITTAQKRIMKNWLEVLDQESVS